MDLLALVDGADHVCCRYRITAFRPMLERAGHRIELAAIPRHAWQWFGLAGAIRRSDAVILQRKFLKPMSFYLLRQTARRLIFDFDDAVFLHDSYDARGQFCASLLRRFEKVVSACDAVVAGNPFLGEHACRWTASERVHVVPTCIDPQLYPLAKHIHRGEGVELVWIGSSSTLQGLEKIESLLETIGRRCPGVHLKLVCDRFLKLRHLPVLPVRWSEADEAAELATADIGISWVPDDLWSRGKCGLKVLQYMAAGLPVVANPIGVHADMVRHGTTGFLARTVVEWLEAITTLADDPELRQRMGRAGRQRLEDEFSVSVGAARWLDVLSSLEPRRIAV